MPRVCTVCSHQARDQIEAELLDGKPFRELAERFGTSVAALFRHRGSHIPERLVKSHEALEISKADNLAGQIEELQRKTRQIVQKAEADDDLRTALAGLRELSRLIEVARKSRELSNDPASDSADSVDDATARRMAEAFLERCKKEEHHE